MDKKFMNKVAKQLQKRKSSENSYRYKGVEIKEIEKNWYYYNVLMMVGSPWVGPFTTKEGVEFAVDSYILRQKKSSDKKEADEHDKRRYGDPEYGKMYKYQDTVEDIIHKYYGKRVKGERFYRDQISLIIDNKVMISFHRSRAGDFNWEIKIGEKETYINVKDLKTNDVNDIAQKIIAKVDKLIGDKNEQQIHD